METLAQNWNKFAHWMAEIAAYPVNVDLLIGLRVLLVLTLIVVTHAQLKSWRGKLNFCRHMTGVGSTLITAGIAMSAVLAGQGGDNVKLYQMLVLLGLLLRVVADGINAGHRRRIRRMREGREKR